MSTEEREEAINRWMIYEQDCLRQQPNFQKLFSSLNLFEDCQNILWLKGRFGNSLLEYDQKYPIILRGYESLFTRLLIVDAHKRSLHKEIEFTLNCVRSKFWICQERKTVIRVLRDCLICKRYQARPVLPLPSPGLPDFRINISSYSFQSVGLDFAGPLLIESGKDNAHKAYILLFTCASSRAVHLELIPHMSIPSFIRAVKRFVSREGMPERVIRDNFKTSNSVEVKNYFVKHGVKQSFILPASPWWGDFFERLV